MALFEGYERKIDKINGVLAQYGLESVEACRDMCIAKGFDPYEIVKGIQPIASEPNSSSSTRDFFDAWRVMPLSLVK